jgi:hypothetical protein
MEDKMSRELLIKRLSDRLMVFRSKLVRETDDYERAVVEGRIQELVEILQMLKNWEV